MSRASCASPRISTRARRTRCGPATSSATAARSRPSRTRSRGSGRRRVSASTAALAAILAGLLWSIGAIDLSAPQPPRVALLLAGVVLLFLAAGGARVGLGAAAYAVAIGASERLAREPLTDGSDVLPATLEGIGVMLAGANPYTHVMQSTIPVGSPFVYPPGELLFYLPAYLAGWELQRVETWTGILTVGAIALAGARAGWGQAALPAMLYATWGIAAFRTTDGGNDVSAAFLVTVALVALAFPGRLAFFTSAAALGWALAFKQFAVLVVPLVLRHLAVAGAPWRPYALAVLGTATVMTLPFFLMDPPAFVRQQLAALTFHQEVWGANLLHGLQAAGTDVSGLLPAAFLLELALTAAALALALRSRPETLGRSALLAAAVVTVPLLLARWTTQSYYVYAATLALTGLAVLAVTAPGYQGGTRSVGHAPDVVGDSS